MSIRGRFSCLLLALLLSAFCGAVTHAQDEEDPTSWPGVFSPLTVLQLNLELDPGDWQTVQADETFDIEVPAWFWADGEEPILVSVRRKSATPVGNKVSLKIDINEFKDDPGGAEIWRGLKKLSLENGDDTDVVSEGLAWYLHRLAAEQTPGYMPGLAAWVNLKVNGENHGVYVNVEQPDKQFLKNRDLWFGGDTWLYKQGDIGEVEIKEEGDAGHPSPTYAALNYSPFRAAKGKGKKGSGLDPTPDDDSLALELPWEINMTGMLTLGAVNAFTTNPDELFNHGKNFLFSDYSIDLELPRQYFPWDLDAVIRDPESSIYALPKKGKKGGFEQHPYQEVILNHPDFRAQYNAIMTDLLDGGFDPISLGLFLDDVREVLEPYLAADDDSKVGGDVAGHIEALKLWVGLRYASVLDQIEANEPPPRERPEP